MASIQIDPWHTFAGHIPKLPKREFYMAKALGWVVLVTFILMIIMPGCASAPKRNPLPQTLSNEAVVPGYPNDIRYWGEGIEYYWTAIPDDFNEKPKELFDPDYTQKLVEVGFQRAKSGTAWKAEPPGYKVK